MDENSWGVPIEVVNNDNDTSAGTTTVVFSATSSIYLGAMSDGFTALPQFTTRSFVIAADDTIPGYDTAGLDLVAEAATGDMRFFTGAADEPGQEKVHILSGGNVGIGESDPATLLHIFGGLTARPTAVTLSADNQLVTVGNSSYLQLSSGSATPANWTFCLTAGLRAGQLLVLTETANAAELQDNATPCGGGENAPQLVSNWQPVANGTLVLIYDGTHWVEFMRSSN
jgi:hypothetical protein